MHGIFALLTQSRFQSLLQELYRAKNCEFLLEEGDTIAFYEEQGVLNTSGASVEDKAMRALEGVGRVQAVEMLTGSKRALVSCMNVACRV